MPPLPSELKLLLDNLIAQVQQLQASNDAMHGYVQGEIDKIRAEARAVQAETKQEVDERLKKMSDDLKKVLERLEKMESSIIDKQAQGLRRTIAVQAAVLTILGSGIFGLIEFALHH